MYRRRLLLLSLLVVACRSGDDLTAPATPGPPYLAILTRFDAPAGAFLGDRYTYRIRATAEGTVIDTTVTAAPTDTVILSVRPADYTVSIGGLPQGCAPRRGANEAVFIPADANTGVVRYFIICDPKLGIDIITEGRAPDSTYIFRLRGPGIDSVGVARGGERLVFPRATAGTYRFELADVAADCVVTSVFGDDVPIIVPAVGGAVAEVRVTCSERARRPVVQQFVSRAVGSQVTLWLRAVDPERDIARYAWELADCSGRAVAAGGRRIRQNLASAGPVVRDTSVIAGVFETDRTEAELVGLCSRLLLFDLEGNSSEVALTPILRPTESAPIATTFNARIVEDRAIVISLRTDDPQRDQSSVFPIITLRDGILGTPDGKPDVGIYAVAGYLDPADIPDLPVGGTSRIQPFDVLAIEVFLFDRTGDVRRVRDTELRQ